MSLIEAARELVPRIAATADEIEQERRLPPALFEAMADAGLFRMAVPAELGGSEADPLTMTEVVAEITRADGSAGWCVLIGWQAAVIALYMPEQGTRTVLGRDPLP